MGRFTTRYIEEAKNADLVDYMLIYHPDKVINRSGLRDAVHDSLVLYPHTYCRYSTMEVNDSITYLTKYQGYGFKDAVNSLHKFAETSVKPLVPEPAVSCTEPAVKMNRFYSPLKNGNIKEVEQYLTEKRD